MSALPRKTVCTKQTVVADLCVRLPRRTVYTKQTVVADGCPLSPAKRFAPNRGEMEMRNFTVVLEQMNFLILLWLFYGLVVLHELEEWNIDCFERRHFSGLPARATDRSARMVIAFVSALGLVWCAIATLPGDPALAAWIFFPAIAFMLLNALQHIFWSFHFRELEPGAITAALLIIPSGGYIVSRAIAHGFVPAWYALALGAVAIIAFTNTVLSGSRMPALIRTGNRIGIWLSDRLR
jgi:hypothetical protein